MSDTGELHRLMDAGDYARCLERGQAMLREHGLSADDRVRVLGLLCRCRIEAGDFLGAVPWGTEAAEQAERLANPDLRGSVLIDLATALIGIRRYAEALARLDQYQQGLHETTSARVLEGTALRLQGDALTAAGREADALARYDAARNWFLRYGDEPSAGECLLGMLAASHAMGDSRLMERLLEEGEDRAAEPAFQGWMALYQARLCSMTGQLQASVDHAFRALELAAPLSPLQVEAQLHLSGTAERMERAVDALSFALAARVSAIDGRLYSLEMRASVLLLHLLRRHGGGPLRELEDDLAHNGVDLYQYVDPTEVQRLVSGT